MPASHRAGRADVSRVRHAHHRARPDAALASDTRYADGTARVLDGIPVGIKDIYETAGVRTTAGPDALADGAPDEDATVVAHLHDTGAVMVAKTVTHEFAFGASSVGMVAPPVRVCKYRIYYQ